MLGFRLGLIDDNFDSFRDNNQSLLEENNEDEL